MGKHDLSISKSRENALPEHVLNPDRDIIHMAKLILAHFTGASRETAFALLQKASRRQRWAAPVSGMA